MRYDEIYTILAERAHAHAMIDIEAFVKRAQAQGMAETRIQEEMLRDLEQGGPLFGKFFRQASAAAAVAADAAFVQGSQAGQLAKLDVDIGNFFKNIEAKRQADTLQRFVQRDLPLEDDPGALDDLVNREEDRLMMWQAELENTCAICLPLHGKTLSYRAWRDVVGLIPPEGVHPDSWDRNGDGSNRCHCELVYVGEDDVAQQRETIEPLRRVKVEKGQKRTQRAIESKDIEKAQQAVWKALDTPEGRATLARLGRANA